MPKNATSPQALTAHERRLQAAKLRMAGMTYRQIAEELDYRGPSGAYKAVKTLLRRTELELAQEFRQLELERLDFLTRSIWDKVCAGDLKAIDRLLRIMERRSRLLGLDAPNKVAHTDADGEEGTFTIVVNNPLPIRERVLPVTGKEEEER